MKKVIAFLLVVAMLCSFAACVANPDTTTTENPGTTNTPGDTTAAPTDTTAPIEPVDPVDPVDPVFPSADTAYYFGMVQENKNNAVYYLAGGMNSYYLETTTDASAALKVYLEKTEGGYYLYCYEGETKTYINMVASGTHVNGKYEAAASTVYTHDAERNILIAKVNDTEYTFGTRNDKSYTTVGPVAVSQNGFWCKLYTDKTLPAEPEKPEMPEFDTTLTVKQLLELPLTDGDTTSGRYYVRATIKSITNAAYGAMIITDSTGSISVYGSKSADGTTGYADLEDKPLKGDEVLLYVNVKNFEGNFEINSAWIKEVKHNTFDDSKYTSMTIAEARKQEVGKLVKVEGVVAAITNATGFVPDGVILVDSTGSILIYDRDLAGRVSVGNKISLAGTKAMWINDSETGNAAKYHYAGSNQIDNAWLLTNDNGKHDFDKTWIQESTVKEIVDTPITTDISTVIYKVNALVTEKAGNGFTNFYLYDLDGTTGSYTYTKCNGNDFAWLREFEGKICTVYMMAINAKSEPSGCFWRFLPIAVKDENFDTASVNIPEFVVKYFGVDQFDSKYSGNPATELLTSVSSKLLGIKDAKLSYQSSDETIISVADNKLVCLKDGKVTITITCEYGDKTYSQNVEVEFEEAKEMPSISVKEAIAAAVGDAVTVKGIVGPSLVNRKGFYLMSDEGMIAIITDDETMAGLQIGNTVILSGTRAVMNKYLAEGGDPAGSNHFGQSYIKDAKVEWNGYGEASWDTSWYIKDKTPGQLNDLDALTDYTTNVYVITGEVLIQGYNYKITGEDGKDFSLYASGAAQYAWLAAYNGQKVTVTVACCNWNDKQFYKGCVLSIIVDGVEIYNELNFSK